MKTLTVRLGVVGLALALIAFSAWHLERQRAGLEIVRSTVDRTPVTVYRLPETRGPAVVIAHGFAGSRQLMEAWALTLAHAGYQAVSFDFLGHGRHPEPMSGDVTRIEGTTQLLIDQTRTVMDYARRLPGAARRDTALLGHSMASDVIIRTAIADSRVGPVVAISAFSQAITATEPRNLLLITGAWETHLRSAALDYLHLVDPDAGEGAPAVAANGVHRAAWVSPHVEHVGVLYGETGLATALAWLNEYYGRSGSTWGIADTGPAIALLLLGCWLIAWPLAALVPPSDHPPAQIPTGTFWAATLVPAIVAPLSLSIVDTGFLPVLVADYLAAHLLVYGLIALGLLRAAGIRFGRFRPRPLLLLLAWGLGLFGLALDRYAASFVPEVGRLPIIAAVALGSAPFMVADIVLTEAGHAAWWRGVVARAAFIASLAVAVALDFEGLMFLLIIAPVIVLFYLVYGTAGGWFGRRGGQPLPIGLALGIILAWAIGVSFPMFA